jgi:S-formylglutathione hydrolase
MITKVVDFKLETNLVPSPIKYSVLRPKNYDTSKKSYPLALALHGGGGYMGYLRNQIAPIIVDMWERKLLPEMIFVTPHCDRSFYIDYRDGSQKWETFIISELMPHLREQFRISTGPNNTFLTGTSMGGMGTLRLGLKHLDIFGVIIAFEPAIEPALEWKDIKTRDKRYRGKAIYEEKFGNPVDEEYWKSNNPIYIAKENAKEIRESGLKIYLEVGTEDTLGLFEGVEFLHRVMFDNKIPHEFRHVFGADHVGPSMKERFFNGYSFLNRMITDPYPDRHMKKMLTKIVQKNE